MAGEDIFSGLGEEGKEQTYIYKIYLRMSFEGQISDTKTGHPFNIRWWSPERHFEFDLISENSQNFI